MARPREFDENAVLDAVQQCFWRHGYEATSIKDLVETAGITAASLYNAYGDKRQIFLTALERYVEQSVAARMRRCEQLPPREAIAAFFDDIVNRSLNDCEHKGCLLVNSALELAPHDPEFQRIIAGVLVRLEGFFLGCIESGQACGSISRALPAKTLAQHLLGVLLGIRVLARVRPEPALLKGVVATAMALLEPERS